MRRLLCALALLCAAQISYAVTREVTCSGNIGSAIQTAVNASSDDDIINISAGTCQSDSVSWTNKNITIQGQGKTQTIMEMTGGGFAVVITSAAKASFRITGFRMWGAGNTSQAIFINSENATEYTSGWRIDNIDFDYDSDIPGDPIVGWGMTFGVFDHNDFHFTNLTWILFAGFQTGLGELTWGSPAVDKVGGWYNLSIPSQYNSPRAVYFEDNVFTASNNYNAFYDASSGGHRVVFRHNDFIGGFIYNHWIRVNDLDIFQWEVYNNRFVANANWGEENAQIPARFESGTGVFYNNAFIGNWAASNQNWFINDRRASGDSGGSQFYYCDGAQPWDGNLGDPAAPGWPCLGQAGRDYGVTYADVTTGTKQASLPVYSWNNGLQEKCADPAAGGAACVDSIGISPTPGAYIKSTPHPNGDVDFVLSGYTPQAGYVAYTYPHPLVSGAPGDPGPPNPISNLTVIGHAD